MWDHYIFLVQSLKGNIQKSTAKHNLLSYVWEGLIFLFAIY